MTTISAVLITLNEEENIENCLKTVEWCDEIILVDSCSEDKTVEIARDYADKIIKEESSGGFDQLREKGIEEAEGDWILRIDADEMIPRYLAEKLQEMSKSDYDIIKVSRQNYIFGEWMKGCGWWPDYEYLLFRPGKLQISSKIHEWAEPHSEARIKEIEPDEELAFKHFTRLGIEDVISHMNRYTTIEAEQSEDYSVVSLVTEPCKEFIKRFILFKGYSEGYRGFMLSMLRVIYVFVSELKKIEKSLIGGEESYKQEYEKEAEKIIKGYRGSR